jgi:hypothetical protein
MKNKTIISLSILVVVLSGLLAWEKLKLTVIEEEYLNSSLQHLFAGAMETVWLRSNQEETYFYLMESTFENLPEVVGVSEDEGLKFNESSLENTKEMIAHYYVLSGYEPSERLTEFLGDYLGREYKPYSGFDLPEDREDLLRMIEANQNEH